MISAPPGISSEDFMGMIFLQENESLVEGIYQNSKLIIADFYNRNRTWAVSGGELRVDGNIIPKFSHYVNDNGEDSAYTYMYNNYPLQFNGNTYNIDIAGDILFPAQNVQVSSPPCKIDLTNVSNGTTFSKSNDMVINWSCSQDTTTKIAFIFTSATAPSTNRFINDTGTLIIPSSDLQNMVSADYTLTAMCYNYELVQVNNDDYLLCLIFYSKEYEISIQ